MCTAIAHRSSDIIYGFNLDIDPEVWSFGLYKTDRLFSVGITVGKTLYYTHGVNRRGDFSNVPYMNGEGFIPPKGAKRERIDLLTDRLIRQKYSFEDVKRITREKTLVNAPAATLHSLIGNAMGEMLIAEPGYGVREVTGNYAVISNFPVLALLTDYSNPFYGKDRYDRAEAALRKAGESLRVTDALKVLESVKQEGKWGTKISFVYSRNENNVYYCLNGDFSDIKIHSFETGGEQTE